MFNSFLDVTCSVLTLLYPLQTHQNKSTGALQSIEPVWFPKTLLFLDEHSYSVLCQSAALVSFVIANSQHFLLKKKKWWSIDIFMHACGHFHKTSLWRGVAI